LRGVSKDGRRHLWPILTRLAEDGEHLGVTAVLVWPALYGTGEKLLVSPLNGDEADRACRVNDLGKPDEPQRLASDHASTR
jgi:hypothetical protein